MVDVFRRICAGHEDVIEVDEHKGDSAEDIVHQPLEGLGGVRRKACGEIPIGQKE